MRSIRCGLKAVLAAMFVWPAIGIAAPIVDDPLLALGSQQAVVGWANSAGNFVVDYPGAAPANAFAAFGQAGYSAASGLLSYEGSVPAIWANGNNTHLSPDFADVQMNVIVQGNGTTTGNLRGGFLTVRAGADGIAALGAAPGELLMAGFAIDSAALPILGVSLLFDLTYTIGSLSGFGDYLTFAGAYSGVWGVNWPQCTACSPWGTDWGPTGGWTLDDFVPTHRVAEPGSYALMLAALGVMGFAIRRRKATRG